ncbi:4724_t:CDS:2, partial [Cetraspora pellucida]
VLNEKMKVLKQSEKVTKHYDPLLSDELKTIFNHKTLLINMAKRLQYQFTFLSNEGIQFTKFSQKNDPSSIKKNLDSLIISVLADLKEYLGPVHDIKFEQQKKDALSILISVVDLLKSQNNDGIKDFFNKKQDLKPNNYDSFSSYVSPKSSVYSEFQSSLKNSTKPNLTSHINATKKNPTLGEKRLL